MKPKYPALVAFAVAIVCVALWWFTQQKPTAPEKTAEAPMVVKTDAPKLPAPPPQVEKPLAPPAQTKPETSNPPSESANPPPASADPQSDLKTAIPDFLRILKSGDFATIVKTYMPPSQTANMPPGAAEQMQSMMQSPQGQQIMQAMIMVAEYEQTQSPTYSDDGNTAFYSDVPNPNGDRDPSHPTKDMFWVKENGKWYFEK